MCSPMASSDVYLMHVPAYKAGVVIGKRGAAIKQIIRESGAHVELCRYLTQMSTYNERVFLIKGDSHCVQYAQHLIKIRVGEIPPSTPFVPVPDVDEHIPVLSVPPDTFCDPSFARAVLPPQAAAFYHATNPNCSSFNNGNYVSSTPSSTSSTELPPSPLTHHLPSALAIVMDVEQQKKAQVALQQNDFSAQWVAYYRQLGLHVHADMIEQQAKQLKAGIIVHPCSPSADNNN